MSSKPQISEQEALELLNDIEFGFLAINEMDGGGSIRTWKTGPERIIGGGWWISIFDDAGDWDYISSILSPDGNRCLGYEDIHQMPELSRWEPSDEALKTIWRW
jgi:hypothetical protein